MRKPALTTGIALTLVLGACDRGEREVTTDAAANDSAADVALGANETDSNLAAAAPTDAAGFAAAVAASDLYEIESASLAAQKATSADLKAAADHIKSDHQKSSAELKTAAQGAGVTVEPKLDAEKQAMLDQLKAASGADFDRLFLDQQKTAHQTALDLVKGYTAAGDNAALKGFASKAQGVIQGHIDHLNGIKLQ